MHRTHDTLSEEVHIQSVELLNFNHPPRKVEPFEVR